MRSAAPLVLPALLARRLRRLGVGLTTSGRYRTGTGLALRGGRVSRIVSTILD